MQNLTDKADLSIIENSSSLSVSRQISDITGENAGDEHLSVQALLTGSTVPLFDVFLLVIAVLVDVATKGATEQLRQYLSPSNIAEVIILFTPPVPARTGPPFFEVQWLMKTMASIPQCMFEKGMFREALVLVDIDNVRVAEGVLGKKESVVGMTNADSNMSAI